MSTVDQQSTQQTEFDQELLKKRRLWYFVALGLFLFSILLRQPIVLLAAIFTFLVGFIPEIWFRIAFRHLLIRQHVQQQHLFFGEQAVLHVMIENRKWLPLPWLQVDNAITPPLTVAGTQESRFKTIRRDVLTNTWLLKSYQRVTRRYRMTCSARGFHIFGPMRLRCSDPFGWLEREIYLPAHETLLVYPLLIPFEALGFPSAFPMGEHIGVRHLLEDPLWFAGNREYQRGDDPRRIDWKATARVGELRSKIYESTTERHFLILLDTWVYSDVLKGVDREIQEFCIAVAASLATWALDEGYTVGVLTNSAMVTATQLLNTEVHTEKNAVAMSVSEAKMVTVSAPGVSIPFARDNSQYEHILSTFARLVPENNTPIEHMLENEHDLFPHGTTILLVSAVNTLSEQTMMLLGERRRAGNAVSLVLVGDQEEEHELPDTGNFPVQYIGGKEKWHELIQTVGDSQQGEIGASSTHLQLD